jgi:hypothetical protein
MHCGIVQHARQGLGDFGTLYRDLEVWLQECLGCGRRPITAQDIALHPLSTPLQLRPDDDNESIPSVKS